MIPEMPAWAGVAIMMFGSLSMMYQVHRMHLRKDVVHAAADLDKDGAESAVEEALMKLEQMHFSNVSSALNVSAKQWPIPKLSKRFAVAAAEYLSAARSYSLLAGQTQRKRYGAREAESQSRSP